MRDREVSSARSHPPMEPPRKPVWGPRAPGVGGANGVAPPRGNGEKRPPKDGMGANMGVPKRNDRPGSGRTAGKSEYSEEVWSLPHAAGHCSQCLMRLMRV